MPVKIHDKEYLTVADRVNTFREKYPDWSIQNSIVEIGEMYLVFKSEIFNNEGRLIASGHAEERRNSSQINRTSALENAETSAVGRALAFFGLAGTEIASADEVKNAIHQQKEPATPAPKLDSVILPEFVQRMRQATTLAILKRTWQEGSGLLSGEDLKAADAVKEEMKEKLS
jgi:hypothetical protein